MNMEILQELQGLREPAPPPVVVLLVGRYHWGRRVDEGGGAEPTAHNRMYSAQLTLSLSLSLSLASYIHIYTYMYVYVKM